MPPPDSGHALTEKQIDLLQRWIDEGAKWDTHWAYVAAEARRSASGQPTRTGSERRSIGSSWRVSSAKGSKPSPEADKETLLRRVTYDLTGLPPTPAEVDAFLADRSPDAYEKRVDALLQSPHYGERMAMPWLDAARYADTHGYHIDSLRGMWPWRDWVINAFNRNMPFDQFAIEQLAGDLLPERHRGTEDRLRLQSQSHDQLRRRARSPKSIRSSTSSIASRRRRAAFMGLTMGCARCHSHKFDPITQRSSISSSRSSTPCPSRAWTAGPATPRRPAAAVARVSRRSSTRSTRRSTQAGRARRQPSSSRSSGSGKPRVTPTGRRPSRWRRARRALRAGRQLLRHLGSVSARPDGDGRSDVRRRADRQGGVVRRRHGGQLRQCRRVRSRRRLQPGGLAEGPRQPAESVFQKLDDPQHRRGLEWRLDDVQLVGIQRWAARLTISAAPTARTSAIQLRTRDRLTPGRLVSRRTDVRRLGQGGRTALVRGRQLRRTSRSSRIR